jgi:hypothetical protein
MRYEIVDCTYSGYLTRRATPSQVSAFSSPSSSPLFLLCFVLDLQLFTYLARMCRRLASSAVSSHVYVSLLILGSVVMSRQGRSPDVG